MRLHLEYGHQSMASLGGKNGAFVSIWQSCIEFLLLVAARFGLRINGCTGAAWQQKGKLVALVLPRVG